MTKLPRGQLPVKPASTSIVCPKRGETTTSNEGGAKTTPFAAIPHAIAADPRLKRTDVCVVTALLYFAVSRDRCTVADWRIGEFIRAGTATVSRSLARLVKLGYVQRLSVRPTTDNMTGRILVLAFKADSTSIDDAPPVPSRRAAKGHTREAEQPEGQSSVIDPVDHSCAPRSITPARPGRSPVIEKGDGIVFVRRIETTLEEPEGEGISGPRTTTTTEVTPPEQRTPASAPIEEVWDEQPAAVAPAVELEVPADEEPLKPWREMLPPTPPPRVVAPPPALPANLTDHQRKYIEGLPPDQRERFDGLDGTTRDYLLRGFANGEDRAARAESDRALGPRRAVLPIPHPGDPLEDLLAAMDRGDNEAPMALARRLASDHGDAHSYKYYFQACQGVLTGALSAADLREILRQTAGPRVRDRGRLFVALVKKALARPSAAAM